MLQTFSTNPIDPIWFYAAHAVVAPIARWVTIARATGETEMESGILCAIRSEALGVGRSHESDNGGSHQASDMGGAGVASKKQIAAADGSGKLARCGAPHKREGAPFHLASNLLIGRPFGLASKENHAVAVLQKPIGQTCPVRGWPRLIGHRSAYMHPDSWGGCALQELFCPRDQRRIAREIGWRLFRQPLHP